MKNVLLISHSLIPSVLLCGHSQLKHLKKQNKIDYRYISSSRVNSEILSWADIIVFVRSESHLEKCASDLCKDKKHLVYILDDDLLNLPEYVSCFDYYNIPSIHSNIVKIMNNCDVFLTPSKVLLNKYGSSFKYSNTIDEPSLNCKDKIEKNNKVRIGFAGSIDRAQDINDILIDTLEELIKKYGDKIEIEFMGAKPDIVDKYNLKYIPYQDSYKKYSSKMGELNWDIGIAPMPISEFHSCKYFNKYVEYASYGIAGVYTKCEPYIYGIKDGVNGLLVNNTKKEWVDAISKLIDDEKLREAISKESIKEANTIYSLNTLSDLFLENIEKNCEEKKRVAIQISTLTKLKILYAMIRDKMLIQRWHFPFWCVKYICIKILEKIGIMHKKDMNLDWEE